jgi:hypothetical protein
MLYGLHVKYASLLSHTNESRMFSTSFPKNIAISNFMKIRTAGVELFRADGRTDGWTDIKPIVAFCNFAKAPNTFRSVRMFV